MVFGWVQLFLLAQVALQLVRFIQGIFHRRIRPEIVLAGSFACLIVLGTLLLLLPRASAVESEPITLMDALFTATSAVCVTGLVVRDTGADFSTLGQMTILGLFQAGGLGIVTFVAFISIFSARSLPVPQLVLYGQALGSPAANHLKRRLLGVVLLTLLIEALGAIALYHALGTTAELSADSFQRVLWSVFHSVSAFCNAGFAMHGDSLELFRNNPGINLSIMLLVTLGSLGFLVIPEVFGFCRDQIRRFSARHGANRNRHMQPRQPRLSVQVRLSLWITILLIVAGTIGFWLLERSHSLATSDTNSTLLVSMFQSITTRTAGFNTVPIGDLQPATLLFLMALMVIGGCPISTAGGIKTVTAGILLLTLRSLILQRQKVEAFGRTIPQQALIAALSVFVLYTIACGTGVFLLALSDPDMPLRAQCFEVVSALSTVGLSTGITHELSTTGKLVLCAAMFIGRVGPISLVMSIFQARHTVDYDFPEGDVVVG